MSFKCHLSVAHRFGPAPELITLLCFLLKKPFLLSCLVNNFAEISQIKKIPKNICDTLNLFYHNNSGLGIRSFQNNATFLRSFPFFIKEHGVFAFFSVLYKRTQRSLYSFTFFIKERGVRAQDRLTLVPRFIGAFS